MRGTGDASGNWSQPLDDNPIVSIIVLKTSLGGQ
jgi:hypothetical protein